MAMMSKPLPMDPELADQLEKAKKWWETATPEQVREMKAAQRKSWVVGEMMLEHPDMTREEAERLYALAGLS